MDIYIKREDRWTYIYRERTDGQTYIQTDI